METISARMQLPEDGTLSQNVQKMLASFVCTMHCPTGVRITEIPDLRWHLFCKNMAEGHQLPLTIGTLEEHVERIRVQIRVWCQATVMWQQLLDPLRHGYQQDESGISAITTKILPASQVFIQLVRCQCKTNSASQRCSCRRNNLTCTD